MYESDVPFPSRPAVGFLSSLRSRDLFSSDVEMLCKFCFTVLAGR